MDQLVTVEGELVMYTDDGPQLQEIVEVHQGIDLTEVRPPVWPLLHLAGVSQPREVQSWKPSGTKEVALDPVSPGGGGAGGELAVEEREVEELVSDHIKELRLVNQPIDDLLPRPLLLEGAEEPVPDTQPAAVVLVQAVPVGAVVDPVVRGRVEDQAQRPEVSYQLGVDQELVEEVKLGMDHHLGGRNDKGQGQIEPVSHPANTLQHGLSEGGGQVEVFTVGRSHKNLLHI